MIRILLSLSLPLVLLLLIEQFILRNLYSVFDISRFPLYIYVLIAALGYLGLITSFFHFRKKAIERGFITNIFIGLGFVGLMHKLILAILLLLVIIISAVVSIDIFNGYIPAEFRESGIVLVSMLAIIPAIALIYGMIWGKYNYQVEHVTLEFDDLPEAFDQMTIVQISDVHAGTWDSVKGVKKGIRKIQQQKADLILFTGDLVNADKNEIDPFITLFQSLEAPYGKYAVLGNHDYYGQPREHSEREGYYKEFFAKYEQMGFKLLLNSSGVIESDAQKIYLAGVENWGHGRYFPKRGDLDLATQEIPGEAFTILMSHDPSHWKLKALPHQHHFHLTLSGHTHGMQFGINLPFFKWSPVQYRYKQWMGLYQESGQLLYVNRGFGLLAYPGRVGMSPEITHITLRKASN